MTTRLPIARRSSRRSAGITKTCSRPSTEASSVLKSRPGSTPRAAPTAIRSAVPGGVDKAAAPTANAASEPAPVQGVDYSGTNVQETGVDEPDLVKTDGNTLFTIDGNQLESVDVRGAAPKLLDTLKL